MTRYYKHVENGYILAIGEGANGIEITKDEYDAIMAVVQTTPEPLEGCGYRLKEDLTWEEYELPPVAPADEDEISDSEALSIILGGES